jgi:hypothetical protein
MKKYTENVQSVPIESMGVLCRAITEHDAVAVHERPETPGPSAGALYLGSSPIPLRGGILHA